jgi:type II secretory pathway pseudopilin PulG
MRRPAGGFTLVEAVAALAVLTVLVAVAIPKLSGWRQARQAEAAAAYYKEGFRLARGGRRPSQRQPPGTQRHCRQRPDELARRYLLPDPDHALQ